MIKAETELTALQRHALEVEVNVALDPSGITTLRYSRNAPLWNSSSNIRCASK